MPTLKQNVSKWGADRSWTDAGNEWSVAWGGADKQWYGSILPRIPHPSLSARSLNPGNRPRIRAMDPFPARAL